MDCGTVGCPVFLDPTPLISRGSTEEKFVKGLTLWSPNFETRATCTILIRNALYQLALRNGANCTLKLTVFLELPGYLVLGEEEKQVVAPDECLKNEFRRKIYKQPISIIFQNAYCAYHRHANSQSSKVAFTIAFFAAVNHNFDHMQWTLKHRNTQNRLKFTNHKAQTMTFWTRYSRVLFPKRSVKMIDGSEKRNCQLAFEFQDSHVCEKCSKQ